MDKKVSPRLYHATSDIYLAISVHTNKLHIDMSHMTLVIADLGWVGFTSILLLHCLLALL